MDNNTRIIRTVCKEGVCPLCGGAINYTFKGAMQEYGVYRWKCPHCGGHGQEGNKTVFDGNHYHVFDKNGNACTIVNDCEPADLEHLIALLNEEQREETTIFVRSLIKRKGKEEDLRQLLMSKDTSLKIPYSIDSKKL